MVHFVLAGYTGWLVWDIALPQRMGDAHEQMKLVISVGWR
jgi:hypothetical protein